MRISEVQLQDFDSAFEESSALSPFKDSLVGNIVGEEIENAQNKKNIKQHYIYICDIESVQTFTNFIVIIKKNSEIEKLSFESEEDKNEVFTALKNNYKANFKKDLEYINLTCDDFTKISDQIDFLK